MADTLQHRVGYAASIDYDVLAEEYEKAMDRLECIEVRTKQIVFLAGAMADQIQKTACIIQELTQARRYETGVRKGRK
jgi:hypothetical protein